MILEAVFEEEEAMNADFGVLSIGRDGLGIYRFEGSNYGIDGKKYQYDPLCIETYGRKLQVGDFVLFGNILTQVTNAEGVDAVFVLDMKGDKGEDGGGGIGSLAFEDDGNGNVTLSAKGGTLNFADDGEGNITLEVA